MPRRKLLPANIYPTDLKVLGLIPARAGSKGIPGKNIKLLGGKPLIAYTIESALASSQLSMTMVSTEDEAIAQVGKDTGAQVPFLRPRELSQDTSPTLEVVIHAVKAFEEIGQHFDAVCLLQPTSPFRPVGFIDEAITRFFSTKVDSLISVRQVPHHFNPHWTFEESETGLLKIATGESTIISRRQDLPKSYHRDGSLYITKTDVIVNQGSLYGHKIGFIENQEKELINIDTIEDWKQAEAYLSRYES